MRYYKSAISQYLNFNGVATRMEFWMFFIMNIVIAAVVGWVGSAIFNGATWPATLYSVFIFCPSWSISVRRLHDSGKSGIWLLVHLIPGIGQLAYLILMALPSKSRW